MVVRGVAPLGKDSPLPARRALRPTVSQLAELINTTLTEYCLSLPEATFYIREVSAADEKIVVIIILSWVANLDPGSSIVCFL